MTSGSIHSACLCLALIGTVCLAADRSTGIDDALDHFYNLEYDEAIDGLRAAAMASPEDPRFHNEVAQALLYREMYRSGALESELATGDTPLLRRPKLEPSAEILKEIDSSIERAITLATMILARDPDDTSALFELGVAHAARANVSFFVRKAWFDGLRDVAKSRQLHDKVTALDPQFVDAALTQGAHDYLISQLPLAYKIAGSVIGFRGNRKRGIQTIEFVARDGKRRRVSAQMLLSVIYRRENQPELAVPLLMNLIERYPRNHLFPLELAQMHADAGDLQESMETLDTVEARVRKGAPGFSQLTVDRVRFLRGHILFRHDRFQEAVQALGSIIESGEKVEPETKALAWLRLGQIHDLAGEREEACTAYHGAIAAQPVSEAARQSRLYLLSPYHDKNKESPETDAGAGGVE